MSRCTRFRSIGICALAAAVVLAGCRPAQRTPRETVEAYFAMLGRDPGRMLTMLTAEYHARHGLTIPELEGWSWAVYRNIEPVKRIDPTLAPTEAKRGIESQLAAWLLVQSSTAFQATASVLRVELLHERVEETRARVGVSVQLPKAGLLARGRPFEQVFYLIREAPTSPWKIDQITQANIDSRAMFAAFVAAPAKVSLQYVRERIPDLRSGRAER